MENTNSSPAIPPQSPKPETNKAGKGSKIWKILTIVLIIIIILLLLTQCQCLKNCYFPAEEEKCSDEQATTQVKDKEVDKDTSKESDECSHLGTWTRTGTYLNGELLHSTPSTMNLYEDSYHNETDVCFTEGALSVSGKDMNMKIDNSDCPTGSIPTSYDYTYELECDGINPLHLTFTIVEQGSTIVETYDRAK